MAAKRSEPQADTGDREFVITRVIDAPRALVFNAWTEPAHMIEWWGPHTFTNHECKMDVRTGGAFRIVMQAPDGELHPAHGTYREVVPLERIVMTINHSELSDQWHDMVNPKRDKSAGKPALEALTTVTFEDVAGKTRLTIQMQFESAAIREALLKIGMNEGWSQSLERLQTEVAKKGQPLVVERILDAPVALVWQAITNKEAIKQWSFDIKEFEPVVGFKFEFVGEKDGVKFIHHSIVTEVIPLRKFSYSWRDEGYEGDSLVTMELFPEGNKTRFKLTHVGLESFPPIPDFGRENFVAGWTAIVGQLLRDYVEKPAADASRATD